MIVDLRSYRVTPNRMPQELDLYAKHGYRVAACRRHRLRTVDEVRFAGLVCVMVGAGRFAGVL
jgi:hypothetical protein